MKSLLILSALSLAVSLTAGANQAYWHTQVKTGEVSSHNGEIITEQYQSRIEQLRALGQEFLKSSNRRLENLKTLSKFSKVPIVHSEHMSKLNLRISDVPHGAFSGNDKLREIEIPPEAQRVQANETRVEPVVGAR